MKKIIYKLFWLALYSGRAYADGEETTFEKMGEDGWKLIGCEYCGTKAADGGELKSSSIWIAMKEID